MFVSRIPLCTEPNAYLALRERHAFALDTLNKLSRPHRLDTDGTPIIPKDLSPDLQEVRERQMAVASFVRGLYELNGATEEILAAHQGTRKNFDRALTDFYYPRTVKQTFFKTKQPSQNSTEAKKSAAPDENKGEVKEIDNLLGRNFDNSESAFRTRDLLAEKRRSFIQAEKIREFLPSLGMQGILLSGVSFLIALLGANNTGLKSSDKKVRLASVKLLEAEVQTFNFRQNIDLIAPALFQPNNSPSVQEDTTILKSIITVLSQKDFGINDPDLGVKLTALNVKDLASQALTKLSVN